MIEFDRNGNSSPPGIINIPSSKFKELFVDSFNNSNTRNVIYKNYEEYINDFKNSIIDKFQQWIDGSYTTKKENPSDIDLVNIVDYDDDLNSKQNTLRSFLTVGGSKEKYSVDGYFIPVYSKDDPRYTITEHWINHWADFFGHDRQRRPKALIELSIS